MTRRRVAVSLLALVTLALATTLAGGDQAPGAKSDVEKKLQEALAARAPIAQRSLQATQAAFEAQTVTFDQWVYASVALKDAKLGVATDDTARIAALDEALERASNMEKKIELLYNVGTKGGEAAQYALAQRVRLDAEIELYREQLKPR